MSQFNAKVALGYLKKCLKSTGLKIDNVLQTGPVIDSVCGKSVAFHVLLTNKKSVYYQVYEDDTVCALDSKPTSLP